MNGLIAEDSTVDRNIMKNQFTFGKYVEYMKSDIPEISLEDLSDLIEFRDKKSKKNTLLLLKHLFDQEKYIVKHSDEDLKTVGILHLFVTLRCITEYIEKDLSEYDRLFKTLWGIDEFQKRQIPHLSKLKVLQLPEYGQTLLELHDHRNRIHPKGKKIDDNKIYNEINLQKYKSLIIKLLIAQSLVSVDMFENQKFLDSLKNANISMGIFTNVNSASEALRGISANFPPPLSLSNQKVNLRAELDKLQVTFKSSEIISLIESAHQGITKIKELI